MTHCHGSVTDSSGMFSDMNKFLAMDRVTDIILIMIITILKKSSAITHHN